MQPLIRRSRQKFLEPAPSTFGARPPRNSPQPGKNRATGRTSRTPPIQRRDIIYITAENHVRPPYRPGVDRWSHYKEIWKRHWPEFERTYAERFAGTYGPLTASKKMEVAKLLGCGAFSSGVVRHECHGCGLVLVVPFSCKSRLCLSCYRRKLFGWSVHLDQVLNGSLQHVHITWTLPGRLRNRLFRRGFRPEIMNRIAATLFRDKALRHSGFDRREWRAGMFATVHKSGNGLNYNPHVHMIAARELLNIATGELRTAGFLPYAAFRRAWRDAVLRVLVRRRLLSAEESREMKSKYPRGFNVHFEPIAKSDPKALYRTAEYLASGFFHNSNITAVDHEAATVTFRHRSRLDARTREKRYAHLTLSVHEFMARMLYYLPDHHQKSVRYYGFYASAYRKVRVERQRDACSWAAAVSNSFSADPVECPDCGRGMTRAILFVHQARRLERTLRRDYRLIEGYFRPIRPP